VPKQGLKKEISLLSGMEKRLLAPPPPLPPPPPAAPAPVANLQEIVARKRPGDKVEVEYFTRWKALKAKATLKICRRYRML